MKCFVITKRTRKFFRPRPKIIKPRPKSHRSAMASNSIGLSPIAGLWLALIPRLLNQYSCFAYGSHTNRAHVRMCICHNDMVLKWKTQKVGRLEPPLPPCLRRPCIITCY